jgi:hypothetical protein
MSSFVRDRFITCALLRKIIGNASGENENFIYFWDGHKIKNFYK